MKKPIIWSDTDLSFEYEQLVTAIEYNEHFFNSTLPQIKVFICSHKESFKQHSREMYYKFSSGCVRNDLALILKSKDFLKITRLDYQRLILHEVNHVAFKSFYGSWRPIWLCEGLACFVAQNEYLHSERHSIETFKNIPISSVLSFMYRRALFTSKDHTVDLYSIWYHFTRYLIGLDKKKLLRLMNAYSKAPVKQHYVELFNRRYGGLDKLWLEFINQPATLA